MSEVLQEIVRIDSSRGWLAGELAYAESDVTAAVLLINPHPLMGGRMDNRLVVRLAERLSRSGIACLRFDYGGVGESDGDPVDVAASMTQFWDTGTAPEDPLMVEDAKAALEWLRQNVDRPIAVIGYSFGAYAATRIVDSAVASLILITPTISRHDYTHFQNIDLATLIVHSDNDFATDLSQLKAWIETLPGPTSTRSFPGADHFFRAQESNVADACAEFVVRTVGSKAKEISV